MGRSVQQIILTSVGINWDQLENLQKSFEIQILIMLNPLILPSPITLLDTFKSLELQLMSKMVTNPFKPESLINRSIQKFTQKAHKLHLIIAESRIQQQRKTQIGFLKLPPQNVDEKQLVKKQPFSIYTHKTRIFPCLPFSLFLITMK